MKANTKALMFVIDWNACIKCGACVAVCPLEAGFVSAFDTISVTLACGVACLVCEKVCPVTAISHRPATGLELTESPVFAALRQS